MKKIKTIIQSCIDGFFAKDNVFSGSLVSNVYQINNFEFIDVHVDLFFNNCSIKVSVLFRLKFDISENNYFIVISYSSVFFFDPSTNPERYREIIENNQLNEAAKQKALSIYPILISNADSIERTLISLISNFKSSL